MGKRRWLKLNNQGSTFVLALMVITLITTLALTILTASLQNLAMKGVDRNSKGTFYTADSVMDEIRAGVGLDNIMDLSDAYDKALSTVIQMSGAGYAYSIDNESANTNFKGFFIDEVLATMTNGQVSMSGVQSSVLTVDETARNNVKAYLQTHIKGYEAGMAKVNDVGTIKAYKLPDNGPKWMVIVEDVSVTYKAKKSGEIYFADVTADIEIKFPNMEVDFASTNRLDDFTGYSLIADRNITVKGVKAIVKSSIYAGDILGITANNVEPGEFIAESPSTSDNINIVCGGDNNTTSGTILVSGNADVKSSAQFLKSDIWCTNISTGTNILAGAVGASDTTKGVTISIDAGCNTYVRDDLTAEGQNTVVNLNGKYYGYSYDGVTSGHDRSSAIIINGKNAQFTLGADPMIIGGHAYVDINGSGDRNSDYMTGEAISIKGSQEVYLVPSKYLAVGSEVPVPNPMPVSTWEALVNDASQPGLGVKVCDMTGFFAYDRGYLNTATPYVEKRANNGLVYVYMNFSNKDNAAKYIRDIVNGDSADLKAKLNNYTKSLFGTSGFVKLGTGVTVYTKGAMLSVSGGAANGAIGTDGGVLNNVEYANGAIVPISTDRFALTSMDLDNRYTILTHLLAGLPWTNPNNLNAQYIVNDIDEALKSQRGYTLNGSELTSANMFDNIVDRAWLNNDKEYNKEGRFIQYDGAAGLNYTKMAVKGDYVIAKNRTDIADGGIIVATGTVYVEKDFNGLIIAGGDIVVSKDATFTTSESMVQFLISNEVAFVDGTPTPAVPFRNYFFAFKSNALTDDDSEEVKVESVNYKDIINYNNWRKYED